MFTTALLIGIGCVGTLLVQEVKKIHQERKKQHNDMLTQWARETVQAVVDGSFRSKLYGKPSVVNIEIARQRRAAELAA